MTKADALVSKLRLQNMNKAYVPSQGPEDWQQILIEPDKQWKTGYSAKSLAYCWE